MNRAQLAGAIATKTGLSQRQVDEALKVMMDIIIENLRSAGEVNFAGFGSFQSRVRKGRVGVNPRNTAQSIEIKDTRVAKFKPGKNLKEALKKA